MPGCNTDILDITREISRDLAAWPGDTEFSMAWTQRIDRGDVVNLSSLTLSPHSGTHLDAPLHFGARAAALGEVPLSALIGPCLVVDARVPRGDAGDGPIDDETMQRALDEARQGRNIPSRVLVNTGYRPGNPFNEDFLSFTTGAVDCLAAQGVVLLGTDAPSVDDFDSKDLPAHTRCLESGIHILEHLEIRQVQVGRYVLVALPMKIANAEAAPVRAVLMKDGKISRS